MAYLKKIGSSHAALLSVIDSFCITVITYGMGVIKINKTDMTKLESAYSAAYAKMFDSYDLTVIRQCQFYCGSLPITYRIAIKR